MRQRLRPLLAQALHLLQDLCLLRREQAELLGLRLEGRAVRLALGGLGGEQLLQPLHLLLVA